MDEMKSRNNPKVGMFPRVHRQAGNTKDTGDKVEKKKTKGLVHVFIFFSIYKYVIVSQRWQVVFKVVVLFM